MKRVLRRTVVVGVLAVAALAFGATGHAYKEMAGAYGGKGCGGCGQYDQSGKCGTSDMNANLTPEQREQIDAERTAFVEATNEERKLLFEKKKALWEEMAKDNPDVQKASALQTEISRLRASLDQKRLEHIVAVKKINPEAGKRFCMDGGRAHGCGYGARDCPHKQQK